MKVICKENKAVNVDFRGEKIIYHPETRFPVIKEKEYIVMGLVIYKDSNCIYYLVDDYDLPCWLPYILFNISDNTLPSDWFAKIFDKNQSEGVVFYLSGFSELCNNDDYHDALVEREKWALDIYFQRKHKAQEWYFERG